MKISGLANMGIFEDQATLKKLREEFRQVQGALVC